MSRNPGQRRRTVAAVRSAEAMARIGAALPTRTQLGKSPARQTVALVDIGSNAVRCVVARLDARPGVELVFRRRVQTRLGASLNNELPAEAVKKTLRAVRRFLKRARRDHAPERVLCVATSAVRDAINRDTLLGPLAELGLAPVRILSGAEEGRLGAEAALRALPIEHGVILDLGGGSLQLTPVIDAAIHESQSVPLGVARLARRFLTTDPAAPTEIAALRAEVHTQLAPLLRHVPPGGQALISGGTVHALVRLVLAGKDSTSGAQRTHAQVLHRDDVRALRVWLEPMTLDERTRAPGVDPDRADVLPVAALVLEALLASSQIPALTACRSSVREAILWREAAKLTR